VSTGFLSFIQYFQQKDKGYQGRGAGLTVTPRKPRHGIFAGMQHCIKKQFFAQALYSKRNYKATAAAAMRRRSGLADQTPSAAISGFIRSRDASFFPGARNRRGTMPFLGRDALFTGRPARKNTIRTQAAAGRAGLRPGAALSNAGLQPLPAPCPANGTKFASSPIGSMAILLFFSQIQ
jgi:hypothetical protein